ncbi:MAG: hypothetical protein QOE61_3058 [Micromonosporaceae bacterium]|uniref:hypothetical protein n=1 Tax=Mycobacterium sp. TaxID=1785 RepID=UPI0028B61883|nr:hypothetical protein [Mycobacterium sp.]MDT5026632.1 hypothetical protein [Micromonosporaceae bacterium]MDT5119267.1 hypothetical protein [Mycobacterium sp.]
MSRAKPVPHVFIPDPDVPADPLDRTGRGACRECHLMGRADDPRHKMPDLFDQDEEHRRRAGETTEGAA